MISVLFVGLLTRHFQPKSWFCYMNSMIFIEPVAEGGGGFQVSRIDWVGLALAPHFPIRS